ncbi:MAG: peptidoglycan editing factor PgeF [Clostridiaceae bacterium]
MNIKFYLNNHEFISGMTLKDPSELENNNMALHACIRTEDVLKNRKKLALNVHCELENFVCAHQSHSENFHQVTVTDKGKGSITDATSIPDTDALYTYEPNLLLCAFTADCVPIIFHDKTSGIVGVIHSGWQGTVKEITLKVFERIRQEGQCDLKNLDVQIGAAISQKKFEVDQDVYLKFKKLGYTDDFIYFEDNTGKYHIDNQKIVKKQCELAGIPSDHIRVDETCTFENPDYFSYRQDRNCGRHLSFIMKRS